MADFSMLDMSHDPVFVAQRNEATLAQLAAQTRGMEASADLHDIQAIKVMQDMQAGEALGKLAQGRIAANPNATPSQMMTGLMQDAAAVGDPHLMAQMAGHASTVMGHEAQVLSAGVAAKRQKFELMSKFNDTVHRWVGTATDQASFDRANAEIEKETGVPSPYVGQTYDPRFVKQIQEASMTYKERLEADRKALADEERIRYHDLVLGVKERLAKVRENYNAIIAAKNSGATQKAEGKPIAAPNKDQRDLALQYIQKQSPDLEPEDRLMAGTALAEQARKIVQTRPGMTYTDALPEAYNEVKKDFAEQEKWGGLAKKLRFMGAGKTPLTAMAVPEDPKTWVVGRYYDNGKGLVGKWDGKEFQPVTGD